MCLLLLVWFAMNVVSRIEGNLFTAIAGIEPLLETHQVVINHLDEYISEEEQRLLVLKQNLNLYKLEHTKAMADVPNYLGNPLNIFTLIKRLTADLQYIEQNVGLGAGLLKNVTKSPELIYPTEADLTGAATALIRLQDTYKLNVTELADGKLNEVAYSTPLTSSDCFELGRALFDQDDYINSLLWLIQAFRKYREQGQRYVQLTDVNILEYISFAYYSLGDIENAKESTKKLLALDPTHSNARNNLIYYENEIKENGPNDNVSKEDNRNKKSSENYEDFLYEALCRGDVALAQDLTKRLKCYLRNNHPFLLLAPFKVEQVYMEPDIYLFYDVISDNEIEHLKYIAAPKLKRAKVRNSVKGSYFADYRISMSAWLSDEDSPVAARLSRRVSDMTGLDTAWAEQLQVGNYGIGGHYSPHYDFSRKDDSKPNNRIATVLFYMSSVAEGGATVFTELGLSVFPVKRAAVFWMNLHPSGEGDLATRHAACPVLRGSKWVSNKWIHQVGQELLKPCNLEYQKEGIQIKLPTPILKRNRQ